VRRALLIGSLLILVAAEAYAQSVGGGSGIGLRIGGVGGSGGPPPVVCTNTLVLDYSNSCALIAQGWGQ